MAEAIVGVLGAGILGMLCFFFQSIKSDLRDLGRRLGRVEAILVDVLERLTRVETVQEEHGRRLTKIEATLEEHGRLLAQMADHGDRIAALERAAGAG